MGLVSDIAVIGGIACTLIYALARVVALLIVLRGTTPDQRPELIREVGDMFRRRPRPGSPRRRTGSR
jgi:hypothetical protein